MDSPTYAVTKFLHGKPRNLQDTAETCLPYSGRCTGFPARSVIQIWICFELICNARIVICG